IERGVARGHRAAAPRNRIVERAHPGIRGPDGENRQGELPASRAAQTSEGGRNADRADVCADPRRPAALPEESGRRLFSGVATWPSELWAERTTEAHEQRRRPLFADDAGARGTLYSGALWRRQ